MTGGRQDSSPPRPSYSHSHHILDPSNTAGFWVTALYSGSPPTFCPSNHASPSFVLWSCRRKPASPRSGCQLRNCLPVREEEEDMGEESPVQPRGTPRPLRTMGVQGLQPQTRCTHLADCVQSAAPAPEEPPRTRSHSPMVQVGSPSSCQTEARDPGIPVVLQRPPASQPLCSHPRGAHVARPKVAKAQGISALLQPLGRARLCPAQQPHGLWAKTKDSSVGLKPVKQGTKTCPQRQAPGGSGQPREDWQEVPPV